MRRLVLVILFALVSTSCGDPSTATTSDASKTTAAPAAEVPASQAPTSTVTTEPTISFVDGSCSASDAASWAVETLEIRVTNDTDSRAAVVMGTYADGFTHDDLAAYGSDVSTRPDFINALEIFEVNPASTDQLLFDYGPGTYFRVCMPETNTMVVLDDLTIP